VNKFSVSDPSALSDAVHGGDRRALARTITLVENRASEYEAVMDALYPLTGNAWRIGLTGPPGAGKSTLAGRLIRWLLEQGQRVAYVAVDPTSPFSGGAILGDRIRIDSKAQDQVYIRSIATRGTLGGLSEQTEAVVDVIDAAGFDTILVESVGVGQAEIAIAQAVDSVVVVLVPESGDEIQTMKAGLLEVANIICVNKADRASADTLVATLQQAFSQVGADSDQTVPAIVQTVALDDGSVDELTAALSHQRDVLTDAGAWTQLREARFERRVRTLVTAAWAARFWTDERRDALERALSTMDVVDRMPYAVAHGILETGL